MTHLPDFQPGFPARRREGGFTLVEIAVVIVILGLLLTMLIGMTSNLIGQQRRDATRQRLANVETALTLFVSQTQRLPCPADGSLASGHAEAGNERLTAFQCSMDGSAGRQTRGVVPWRTIGLAEADVTDGWGNRMTYRVAPELILANSMNFTSCDPGGSAGSTGVLPDTKCNSTCSSASFPGNCTPPSQVTSTKGLCVKNRASPAVAVMEPKTFPAVSTGAAYVVISHGENGAGAYGPTGVIQAGDIGAEENVNNAAAVPFQSNTSPTCGVQWFVDDFANYAQGPTRFDDFVIRPGILAVVVKAQLGPRAH